MPVEIVRRGAGTKFDSRKLKKTANEILKLLGERRAELSVGLLKGQAAFPVYRCQKNQPVPVSALQV